MSTRREVLKAVKEELISDCGVSSLLFDYVEEMIALEVSHCVSEALSELNPEVRVEHD